MASDPWASVQIDGVLVKSETPLLRHTLSAGKHVVILTNPVFGLSQTLEVDVPPGGELRRSVKLGRSDADRTIGR